MSCAVAVVSTDRVGALKRRPSPTPETDATVQLSDIPIGNPGLTVAVLKQAALTFL
jgi:hypothetical protein